MAPILNASSRNPRLQMKSDSDEGYSDVHELLPQHVPLDEIVGLDSPITASLPAPVTGRVLFALMSNGEEKRDAVKAGTKPRALCHARSHSRGAGVVAVHWDWYTRRSPAQGQL